MFKENIIIPEGEYCLFLQKVKLEIKSGEKIFKTPEGGDILFYKDGHLSFLEEGDFLSRSNLNNYILERGDIVSLIFFSKAKNEVNKGDFYFTYSDGDIKKGVVKQNKSDVKKLELFCLPLFYIFQFFPNLFFNLKNGKYSLGDTFWYKGGKFYDKFSVLYDISFSQSVEIIENIRELSSLLSHYHKNLFSGIIKEESESLGFSFQEGSEMKKNSFVVYNQFCSLNLNFEVDLKRGFLNFSIYSIIDKFTTNNALLSIVYEKKDIEAKLFKNHFAMLIKAFLLNYK